MKPITLLILLFLMGCSKEKETIEHCNSAILLSEKYSMDSVYIRTDTLWRDPKICGRDLDTCMAFGNKWYFMCTDTIEHWYYTFGLKK